MRNVRFSNVFHFPNETNNNTPHSFTIRAVPTDSFRFGAVWSKCILIRLSIGRYFAGLLDETDTRPGVNMNRCTMSWHAKNIIFILKKNWAFYEQEQKKKKSAKKKSRKISEQYGLIHIVGTLAYRPIYWIE